MRRCSNYRILLLVALVGVLAGLGLVDLRFAAIAGLVVALWMFARSAIALLK
jgi:hypothetical protein